MGVECYAHVAEACKDSGNGVLGSINAGNEVHAGTDPVEWPHN